MSSLCSPDFCLASAIFGKKARNNPVLCNKNVRSLGRAAVIVCLAGYLILREIWVKGREGTASGWHLEKALSRRVSICTRPVNPRGTRPALHALNEGFAATAITSHHLAFSVATCVWLGVRLHWWLQLKCLKVMGHSHTELAAIWKTPQRFNGPLCNQLWIKLLLGYPIHSHLSIVAFPSLK